MAKTIKPQVYKAASIQSARNLSKARTSAQLKVIKKARESVCGKGGDAYIDASKVHVSQPEMIDRGRVRVCATLRINPEEIRCMKSSTNVIKETPKKEVLAENKKGGYKTSDFIALENAEDQALSDELEDMETQMSQRTRDW